MRGLRLVWFCIILFLLVLTVGAIANGKLSGLGSLRVGGEAVAPPPSGSGPSQGTAQTGLHASGVGGAVLTVTPIAGIPLPVGAPQYWGEWLLLVAVAVAVLAGLTFILRSPKEAGVYDFASAMEQLDRQRVLMKGSWSARFRNAALIRYYAIMRSTCAQMGLGDEASETPLEYLARLAAVLKISPADAAGFAVAFDRARYGRELSEEEARSAAESMSRFVEGLKERVARG